jgi:parvulin-like peptidyl-prolyl isomerase
VAKIQAELKGGAKFEDLAEKYSDDPESRKHGGELGEVPVGSFVPEFEAAAKAQELGKPGEPVKSKYGYHIILVEKRTPASLSGFDQVKDQIQKKLTMQKQEEIQKAFVDGIEKEMGYVTGPEAEAMAKAAASRTARKKTAVIKAGDAK